jgi:hypothetical protein
MWEGHAAQPSATAAVQRGEAMLPPYDANIYIYTRTLVWKFCERFFKTRSTIHVTNINIYIYTRTCVHDGTEIQRNLFEDLLAHEKKWISEISSCQYKTLSWPHHGKLYTIEFVSS